MAIGGRGADLLDGGNDDDLLIAGYTAFDGDPAALRAILAEWTSERDYEARVANLSGSGSGPVLLAVDGHHASVFDDGVEDTMSGGSGRDWFFANLTGKRKKDRITDRHSEEFTDDLT